MNIHVFAIAAGMALAALAGPVSAADIYAPSSGGLKDGGAVEETIIPEAEAYQENAEWFIRGNIGFGIFGDVDGTGVQSVDLNRVFSASIGFGRYVIPNVRLGFDVDYRHHEDSLFHESDNIPLTTTSVMFNAIYDFMPRRRMSPYFGGGIGWAFHRLEVSGSSDKNSSSFAANVTGGVSFALRRSLFLDAGYRFSYLGDANFRFIHNGSIEKINDIFTHEFRIGLRYDLF